MSGNLWMLIIIGSIFLIAVSNWWLGFWSNLVSMVNVLLAGLVATSFYQNASNYMLQVDDSWILIVDFVTVWLLFALTYVVLRGLTEQLSKVRVRFHPVLEYAGRTLATLATGFLFVSFLSFTLLLAPIPLDDAATLNDKSFFPEQIWGQLAMELSNNSLSAHPTSQWFGDVTGQNFDCRPTGDAAWFQASGDSIRAKIAETTNLRVAKPQR